MIPRLLCKLFGCRWSKKKRSASSIISEAKADPDFQSRLKKTIAENEAMIEKFGSNVVVVPVIGMSEDEFIKAKMEEIEKTQKLMNEFFDRFRLEIEQEK